MVNYVSCLLLLALLSFPIYINKSPFTEMKTAHVRVDRQRSCAAEKHYNTRPHTYTRVFRHTHREMRSRYDHSVLLSLTLEKILGSESVAMQSPGD